MSNEISKIIVVLGPTSSGKSGAAIRLAKKFNGEVLSADSRQIYRGLDIGSGKVPSDFPSPARGRRWSRLAGPNEGKNVNKKVYVSSRIPHYGIGIVNPRTEYNAAKFKKYADKVIADILRRKKLPIICGGTGFWIKAVVDNITYPEVKPDPVLRSMLRNKPKRKLFAILKKLDPARAKNIDSNNPVRLIRAIEIAKKLGLVPDTKYQILDTEYQFLQIGISLVKEKLQKNIKRRLKQRFKDGMIEEVEKLHFENKLSWKRLESFGLGYKLIPQYLRKEIPSKEELFERIYLSEKNYAKRQITWFKKDKRIRWIENYKKIEKEVEKFLK